MAFLSSCDFDGMVNPPMDEKSHLSLTFRSLSENILSFSSEMEYRFLLDSLSTLSHEELLQWENNQNGFISMYRMHDEALENILKVTSKKEYDSIKATYQNIFIFNDKDSTDLSIYLPVLDASKSITLNPEGLVCIAGKIINMKEFSNYEEYERKLSLNYPIPLNTTIENGINRVYVKTKKRKFSAQLGLRGGHQQAIRVNASKKFLWGWIEYRTAYFWKYELNGPVQFGKQVKSGQDIFIVGNPFMNGTKLYMWTSGTGEKNYGIMTVQL